MTPEFYKKPAPRPQQEASCTLCFKIVRLTGAGNLRRHKNQIGMVCAGLPFGVRTAALEMEQLALDVAAPAKGGAS